LLFVEIARRTLLLVTLGLLARPKEETSSFQPPFGLNNQEDYLPEMLHTQDKKNEKSPLEGAFARL
jgi:hypothetical protein